MQLGAQAEMPTPPKSQHISPAVEQSFAVWQSSPAFPSQVDAQSMPENVPQQTSPPVQSSGPSQLAAVPPQLPIETQVAVPPPLIQHSSESAWQVSWPQLIVLPGGVLASNMLGGPASIVSSPASGVGSASGAFGSASAAGETEASLPSPVPPVQAAPRPKRRRAESVVRIIVSWRRRYHA